MKLLAFHSDPAIKAKYLARVNNHILADNLIRGEGWSNGKGCAVGCTLEAYDHSRYPVELGIPEWLARVEDTLFEGMSEDKSRTWPRDFLDAIRPGSDLEEAKAPFMLVVLRSALGTQENNTAFDAKAFPEVAKVVELAKAVTIQAIELWSRKDIGSEDWESARSAASAASAAARSAASAAEWSARSAESAAWSAASAAEWSAASAAARSAESAAWSAESAESAAWSAESAAKFDYFADELLKILASVSCARLG